MYKLYVRVFSSTVPFVQPAQTGYRNKCEFSIALSPSTKRPVVGFRLGSYEEGEFTVVSADTCAHVPDRMKQLAKVRIYTSTVYIYVHVVVLLWL